MDKKNVQEQRIVVNMVNKNAVQADYVNSFMVHSNPVECVIEFGFVDLPEAMRMNQGKKQIECVEAAVKAKLVMPSIQMPELIKALTEQYNKIMELHKKGV